MPTISRYTLLLLLSLLFLVGCASNPRSRPFNATANADLTRIEVLPMRKSELDVMIVNNPGHSFGLIGVLIAESHLAPRRSWLKSQVEGAGFDHIESFRGALTEALAVQGYTLEWPNGVVEPDKSKVARTAHGTRKAYPSPRLAETQALLDINFGFVGFASAGSRDSAPYRPTVVVSARLMDAGGRNELFHDVVVHNDVFPGAAGFIQVQPDPAHAYADFDALKEAGPDAIEALDLAFRNVAQRVADQLRRR